LSVGSVYGTMVRGNSISLVPNTIASVLHNATPQTCCTERFLHNMIQPLGRRNSAVQDSPFANTIMITMANDRIGYIVDAAAYDTPTFEATGTPLQRGYAETAIVHSLVEMMSQH
jgi:hypothetical protein